MELTLDVGVGSASLILAGILRPLVTRGHGSKLLEELLALGPVSREKICATEGVCYVPGHLRRRYTLW